MLRACAQLAARTCVVLRSSRLRVGRASAKPPFCVRATTRGVEDARNKHVNTLHEVFSHPTSTKLRWTAVLSMLEAYGASHRPCADGNKEHIEMGGRTMFLPRPHNRSTLANAADIVALRHFLEGAGLAPDYACAAAAAAASRQRRLEAPHAAAANVPESSCDGRHLLIFMDNHEARLYRTQAPGSAPAVEIMHPFDPTGIRRHLHLKRGVKHQSTPVVHGDYVTADPRFLKNVIARLRETEVQEILLAGHGTGKSCAIEALQNALRQHAPELASRVVGRLHLSEGHVTHNELLAKARVFFGGRATDE